MGRVPSTFVNHVCLCYHEARNVRHLIKDGYLDAEPFEALRALPTNPWKAWAAMEPLRVQARKAAFPSSAVGVFVERFSLSLRELVQLYENPHWRSGGYGGNPWAGVTAAVDELRCA